MLMLSSSDIVGLIQFRLRATVAKHCRTSIAAILPAMFANATEFNRHLSRKF